MEKLKYEGDIAAYFSVHVFSCCQRKELRSLSRIIRFHAEFEMSSPTFLLAAVSADTADPPTFGIPPSAREILLKSIEAQAANIEACNNLIHEERIQQQRKRERLKSLRTMSDRRVRLDAIDVAQSEKMNQLLDTIAAQIRDRQTTLKADGYQSFVFPTEDVYQGEWKNSRMHGRGALRLTEVGQLYEGEFFLGVRNGVGTFRDQRTQTSYAGKWADGRRQGRGELIEPDGVYNGEFHEGRIHGAGEYVFADTHVYKGEWAEDLFEGQGTYLLPTGTKYEGSWKAGRENGRGTMTHRNGDIYVGEWLSGRKHGQGTYQTPNFIYEGEWHYDTIAGHGKCRYVDGTVYVGEWSKGKYHGRGTYTLPNSTQVAYSGEFRNGKRHGEGTYTSGTLQYSGAWVDDHKHGQGAMKMPCGGVFHGQWASDVQHGNGTIHWEGMPPNSVRYDHGKCIAVDQKEAFKRVAVPLDVKQL